MRITYDTEVDALYIRFKETTVTSKHLEDGIALDYDAANRLAGIEILDAVQRLDSPDTLKHIVFETGAHSETTNRTVAELQANAAAAAPHEKS